MEDWIRQQRALLQVEAAEEASQLSAKISSLSAKACEQEGLSITNLEVNNTRTELFGRCCVELQKIGRIPLPTGFKVGDEVCILPANSRNSANSNTNTGEEESQGDIFGLVKACNSTTIDVVLDEYDDRLVDFPLRLNLKPSLSTHTKMMNALTTLINSPHPLLCSLYRPTEFPLNPATLLTRNVKVEKWYNAGLNESQQEAVQTSLNAGLVSIIHGPPGTGKTSTLIELIVQALERNLKLLVCAPSNIAVDTILLRLVEALSNQSKDRNTSLAQLRNRIIRMGHPARVSASILDFTLDSHIANDEGTEIVSDVRKEMQDLRAKLGQPRNRSSKEPQMTRKEIRTELKQIKKEVISREKAIVGKLIQNSTVVLATCVGASSYLLREKEFDLVIVDEAAQSLEAACWIPILKATRCVLAGDHCQLPPTIKSKEAEKGGLSQTLFEKLILDSRFNTVSKLLNTQYRMNDLISSWASVNMYDGHVQSHSSVANHTLLDILPTSMKPVGVSAEELLEDFPVMLLIDTASTCMYEDASESASSRNVNEANVILQHAAYLVQHGIAASDIGIITPYNGQLELLRDTFSNYANNGSSSNSKAAAVNFEGIEIKTIDGFQGGEKECILISLVRSNEGKRVGFLGEKRRINVAITRAKRHVAVVCDSETCSSDAFIKTLLNHMEDHGQVMPVELYLEQHTSIQCAMDLPVKSSTSSKATPAANASGKSDKKKDNKAGQKTSNANSSSGKQSAAKAVSTKAESVKSGNTGKVQGKEEDALCLQIRDILQLYKAGELEHGQLRFSTEGSVSGLQHQHLLRAGKAATSSSAATAVLLFPKEVSSFHRLFVHQVSEELNLKHVSVGEGEQRQISVSIPGTITAKAASTVISSNAAMRSDNKFHVNSDEETEEQSSAVAISEDMVKLEISRTATSFTTPVTHPPPDTEKTKIEEQNKTLAELHKARMTAKAAATALPGAGGKGKGKKDPKDELDEDAFLDLACQQNMKLADKHKYRLGSTPMPNYEKESAKQKLKSKLAEAQSARKPVTEEKPSSSSSTSSSSSSSSRSKVVKKPPPNFGGGKVGGK